MGRSARPVRRSKSMVQTLFTAGLVVLFLTIAGVAASFVFDQVRQFIAASDMLPNFTTAPGEPTAAAYDPTKPLPLWDGTDRVNVLVMGIDQRGYEEGPWRTDTMIVLTIDPVTMSAGMLSIPRDLWVPIPNYEVARINQAHFFGDLYGYPGGGPALAAETAQYNLGVRIDHYARVNFTAFQKLIDLIGGIDVCVEQPVNDPLFPDFDTPGYDPLVIPAGCQHFDGEMALKYARTRHSEGGDFDRAKRQQQVIMAVFDQVTRIGLLPQLAAQAPELWATLQDAVVTDMTLDQIIALANLASKVESANIRYGVVDENYTLPWTTPDGQQVLVPLRDKIRKLRDYVFTTGAPVAQTDDPATRLADEAATIAVLNGTTTEGLAASATERLRGQGLQVAYTGNADRFDYAESLIIVYTGKDYTAEYVANFLGLPPTDVVYGSDSNAQYDISVILGADYQPPAQ